MLFLPTYRVLTTPSKQHHANLTDSLFITYLITHSWISTGLLRLLGFFQPGTWNSSGNFPKRTDTVLLKNSHIVFLCLIVLDYIRVVQCVVSFHFHTNNGVVIGISIFRKKLPRAITQVSFFLSVCLSNHNIIDVIFKKISLYFRAKNTTPSLHSHKFGRVIIHGFPSISSISEST